MMLASQGQEPGWRFLLLLNLSHLRQAPAHIQALQDASHKTKEKAENAPGTAVQADEASKRVSVWESSTTSVRSCQESSSL